MISPHQTTYKAFTDGVTNDDRAAVAALVSRDFRAELGKGPLRFEGFWEEITRQRTAFPDLGKNVKVAKVAEKGDTLRVSYDMTVTFSGPLTDGWGISYPPTGQTVVIPSADLVEFDTDGKIRKLTVSSQVEMVIGQMF
ncbi:MAG: nuclear transport factor 2 family protein [Candidatus Saccharibacteria bacterium]|nr:MAG: nuclear transport factor 2 family protein [Candidatus Saccharibacteria bacterium]